MPGEILGFRALLDVKLAMNGHDLSASGAALQGDAFDTRGRIILARRWRADHPSLWPTSAPEGELACRFDTIWLGWTKGPVYLLRANSVWGEVVAPNASLLDIAAKGGPKRAQYPVSQTDSGTNATAIPALLAIGIDLSSPLSVAREFGFRIADFDDKENRTYPRLVCASNSRWPIMPMTSSPRIRSLVCFPPAGHPKNSAGLR